MLTAVGSVLRAGAALYRRRLLLRRGFEPGGGLARPLQRIQSSVVNEYIT